MFWKNVYDINNQEVDLKGINLVGLGGYHHSGFTPSNGFLINQSDYNKAIKSLRKLNSQNEKTIFITHGPPKSTSKIDYVNGAGHVGDDTIKKIMNEDLDLVNVHGHIHERGGNVANYKSGIAINAASITRYMANSPAKALLLTIKNNSLKYNWLK